MADTTTIRKWLREHRPDLGVGVRGRLSAEAIAAYEVGTFPFPIIPAAQIQAEVDVQDVIGKNPSQDFNVPTLKLPCGFCNEAWGPGNHELCPVVIRKAVRGEDRYCPCAIADPDKHPRTKGF
jgi:hypothetical protein